VNYKAGGRHWVIDSGCTNHITGERKIFSDLDEDISDFVIITFEDDSKGGVKGIGDIPISKDYSLSNILLVDSLNFNLLLFLNFVTIVINAHSLAMILRSHHLMGKILFLRVFIMRAYI
jgi:hypothetical protein